MKQTVFIFFSLFFIESAFSSADSVFPQSVPDYGADIQEESSEFILSGTIQNGEVSSREGMVPSEEATSSGTLDNYQTGGIYSLEVLESLSGAILSETGISIMSSGANFPKSNTGGVNTTGSMEAKWLSYSDEDNNGYIDTLFIDYEEMLTGSLSTGALLLYSKTGGLSMEKIDTSSGYIFSGFLSGNSLILHIREGNIAKTILSINNTSSSELRLKSIGELGFFSVEGNRPTPLYLTNSFAGYKNVSPKIISRTIGGDESFETNNIPSTEKVVPTEENIVFPQIMPILQSPTNALFESGVFLCTTADCRINMNLAPLFQSGFTLADYTCFFGTGEQWLLIDTDCNPNTFAFQGTGSIFIEIQSKKNSSRLREVFPVYFSLASIPEEENNVEIKQEEDRGKPIVIIDIDGTWKDYFEKISENELSCHSWTCSLNFTGERSYDPEGSALKFLWIYGDNTTKTSKDPGEVKYGIGEHRVLLRVTDASGNFSETEFLIHVLGPKSKSLESNGVEKSLASSVKTSSVNTKKRYKKIKMEFYWPPELLLQGKTGEKTGEGRYRCTLVTAETCTMNFTLTGVLSGLEYRWILDGEEVYRGKNPGAWKFSLGSHVLRIETMRKGEEIPLSIIDVKISIVILPKKQKILPTKKPKTVNNIIPEANASSSYMQSSETNIQIPLLILALGLSFGFLIHRGKSKNHSS